jgi:gamma-glutamyltranspeptidase
MRLPSASLARRPAQVGALAEAGSSPELRRSPMSIAACVGSTSTVAAAPPVLLRGGGNAVDAAVASAGVLGGGGSAMVVSP